jgi:Fe-S cluster biogenesis protein NfuA
VLLGDAFVTVTSKPDAEWTHVKPQVFGAMMDHFASGEEPVREAPLPDVEDAVETPTVSPTATEDSDVVQRIKLLIAERVRPALQMDGGDIEFRGFDEESGTVYVELAGACRGCPSATATLRHGVENMLCHFIPEVSGVSKYDDLF